LNHTLKAGVVLCLIVCVVSGCASRIPHGVVSDYTERGIRLIALAPVDNKAEDPQAARLLRVKVLEALYFKGYPRIPLDMIDERLAAECSPNPGGAVCSTAPEVIGKLLGVDAVMYCSLLEWKTSFIGVYATTTVSVAFELKDAGTGATLWNSRNSIAERHYDFTRKRLELKACQAYEPAVRQVIEEALSGLPDGPDSAGGPPPEKSFWKFWQ